VHKEGVKKVEFVKKMHEKIKEQIQQENREIYKTYTTKKCVKSVGFNMAVINNRHKFQFNTSFH